MLIAKSNHSGTVANFCRENVSNLDLNADNYRAVDDVIANVVTAKHPIIRTNDELGIEVTPARSGHLKLAFSRFHEGSPLAAFFRNKDGYFLSDFSQRAFTLRSYFGATNLLSPLVENAPFSYNRKNISVAMIGNIIGSLSDTSLPSISGGFTCCIITKSGKPYLYIDNGGDRYYVADTVAPTEDSNPWRTLTGEVCCSIIHCNNTLSSDELDMVQKLFLSLYDASRLDTAHLVENTNAVDISSSKNAEVNKILQKRG